MCARSLGWTTAGTDIFKEPKPGAWQHPELKASPEEHGQLFLWPAARVPHVRAKLLCKKKILTCFNESIYLTYNISLCCCCCFFLGTCHLWQHHTRERTAHCAASEEGLWAWMPFVPGFALNGCGQYILSHLSRVHCYSFFILAFQAQLFFQISSCDCASEISFFHILKINRKLMGSGWSSHEPLRSLGITHSLCGVCRGHTCSKNFSFLLIIWTERP